MSATTRTQIDNMQALTAANSITPTTLGVILEAIETELDGDDSSYKSTTIHDRTKTLETSSSSLATRMTAAEGSVGTLQSSLNTLQGTVSNQGSSITSLQSTTSTQGSNITTLQNSYASHNSRIATLETKTNVGGSQYGGTNSIASRPHAIPYYENAIITDSSYPTKYVKITSGSTTQVDFQNIYLPEHRFIIVCQDDIDLELGLDNYGISRIQSMQLETGNLYELTIMRILDTETYSVYNDSNVEFHAFLKQLN